jgi:ubiquinone biosynthesis protein Coq4
MEHSHNPAPNIEKFLALSNSIAKRIGSNTPPIVNLETLRQLPPGTLGRTLAEFYESHHLTPFPAGPRRLQLHDSVHVLTGYGTDPLGEAEVQAFLLGAKSRVAHVFLGLGLLRLTRKQQSMLPPQLIRERLWRAYQRGCRSRFDLDTWHPAPQWKLPLSQVQAQFHL